MSRRIHAFDKAYSFPPRDTASPPSVTPTQPRYDSDPSRLSPTSPGPFSFQSSSDDSGESSYSQTPPARVNRKPVPSYNVNEQVSPRQQVPRVPASLEEQISPRHVPEPPRSESRAREPQGEQHQPSLPVVGQSSDDDEHDHDGGDLGTLNFHRRPSAMPRNASSTTDESAPDVPTIRHGRSHSRQDSISLPSPKPTTPSGTWTRAAGPAAPQRTPVEQLASYDMLQGQIRHEQNRAQELAPPFEPKTSGDFGIAPADADIASIANQLRDHDRRQSEDPRNDKDWRERFLSKVSYDDLKGSHLHPGWAVNRNFAFPAVPTLGYSDPPARTATRSPSAGSASDDDDKSILNDPFTSSEKLSKVTAGWRNEPLDATGADKAFTMHRPSIVALPVYPAPNGSYAQSFKYRLKRFTAKLAWVSVILWQAATWYYLSRRIEGMARVERKMPHSFVTGWMFLAVEILVNLMLGVYSVFTVFTYKGSNSAPKLRLRGDANLPAVDVFVVASGQPEQYTFDCAVAAASMDYPTHRFRVMVLDPQGSSSLQRELNKHGKAQACPHLSYHKRSLLGPESTKAMTVNFGIREAAVASIKGPADYIVVLDAHVIPERNFLRAALPAMLTEPQVGMVKTGSGFINLPLRLDQATATFMDAAEPSSHSKSGFVLRRSALADIGGFPADSWIEDGLVEARLAGTGYTTVQVDETLHWSMARPTYADQINLMMIKTVGPLRTAARMGFFFGGPLNAKTTKAQKARFLARALAPIVCILWTLMTIAFPAMFSYGGIMVLTPDLWHLNLLLESTLLMIFTGLLHGYIWTWATSLPSPRRKLQAWIFAAPYVVIGLVRLCLPRWLFGYARANDNNTFTNAPKRPSFWKRFGLLLIDPHSTVIFSYSAAMGVCIWRAVRDFEHGTIDSHQTALTILFTIGWPSLIWLDFLLGTMIPYKCLLFPSRLLTEPRESFMIRDHYSSVARPKHAFKTAVPFRVRKYPEFVLGFVQLGWSVACLVLGVASSLFA